MHRGGGLAFLVGVATVLSALSGCGAEQVESAGSSGGDSGTLVRFTDAAGREHELAAPARRIVSLVPSATETLRAIGASDALVGVTDYDEEGWTEDLPSVGGGLEPNLEALVALRPDAVIRFHGEQDPRTPERLDELGVRHVAVRPVSLDDLFETNRIVGELAGRSAAADSLSEAIRSGLETLADDVAGLTRKRVGYMLGGSPPWVSGPGTYVVEILRLAGGDNVFADLESPYQAISPEELRSRQIDVVLVTKLLLKKREHLPKTARELPGAGDVGDHELKLIVTTASGRKMTASRTITVYPPKSR